MFGYVRPALERLDQERRDAYQSAYCGLCHALGKRHGPLARLTLQYDFTFLTILLTAGEGEGECVCRRCPANPFRKPRACLAGRQMDAAADQSVILTWHKLSDDVDDHGFFTGLPYRFVRRLFRRSYRRAAKAQPDFDAQTREGLVRLRALEEAGSPELDRAADAFASILACAAQAVPKEGERRALTQLLYHLGRWVYLMDAWDDLDDDKKKGRYNPLDARFRGQARENREYLEATVTHSLRLAGSAASLLELGSWTPIVENILYLGLPAVQSAVLDGRWKEMRKGRWKPHERSLRGAGREP
ncbi:MAG: hypothetical protein HDT33_06515 [Clostridiales bacterium]|nr:hypothetical protein [Clostridiales bacterium]